MQKYYPPDFDPEKLRAKSHVLRAYRQQRGQKRGRRMMEMRMMFPFTLCCDNCKDFVYVGTKFNSKVEKIKGEDYLGIPIWRFYGRCPHCRNEIRFRTDPKTTDYLLESGGSRTHNPRRDAILAEAQQSEAQEEELAGDKVRTLEHKSYSAAEELKTLESLEELRRISKRLMAAPDKLTDELLADLGARVSDDNGPLQDEEELMLNEAKAAFDLREEAEIEGTAEDDESDTPVETATPEIRRRNSDESSESGGSGIVNLLDYTEEPPLKKRSAKQKPGFFKLFE